MNYINYQVQESYVYCNNGKLLAEAKALAKITFGFSQSLGTSLMDT